MSIYFSCGVELQPTTIRLLPADLFERLPREAAAASVLWKVKTRDGYNPVIGSLIDCVVVAVESLSSHPVDSQEVWSAEWVSGCVVIRREHDAGVAVAVITQYAASF